VKTVKVAVQGDAGLAGAAHEVLAGSPELRVVDVKSAEVIVTVEEPRGGRNVAATEGKQSVVLIDRADRRLISSLLASGAAGVLLLGSVSEALVPTIRAVAAGYVVVPQSGESAVRHPVLTSRQQQILGLLVLGLSNAEIAARLFVTESTVKTHVSAIFDKLGVRTRKEAVDLVTDPASTIGGVLGLMGGSSSSRDGYGAPTVRARGDSSK
jgi:DNA-binding NarL/FixJ family response regulator